MMSGENSGLSVEEMRASISQLLRTLPDSIVEEFINLMFEELIKVFIAQGLTTIEIMEKLSNHKNKNEDGGR